MEAKIGEWGETKDLLITDMPMIFSNARTWILALLTAVICPGMVAGTEPEPERPEYRREQLVLDSSEFAKAGEMAYLAFPALIRVGEEEVLISYKRGKSHALDPGAVIEALRFNTENNEVVSREVLGGDPELIFQMGEWIAFPNGRIGNFVDVQRVVMDKGKKRHHRVGTYWCSSEDGGRTFSSMKRLGKIEGVEYGYIFEGIVSKGRVYMLSMSFPELTALKSSLNEKGERVYGEVSVIASSDNGASWEHVRNLSREFGGIDINESSLIADGEGFIVATRGYDSVARLHRVDQDFRVIKERNLTEEYEAVGSHIGRPRLFSREGKLYVLGRNHTPQGPMELVLLRLDSKSLGIERFVVLGPEGGDKMADGYYAVAYFRGSGEGTMFNVITYRRPGGAANADIIRLEFRWDEVR